MSKRITIRKTNRVMNKLKQKIRYKDKTEWNRELKKLQNQSIDDIQVNKVDTQNKITEPNNMNPIPIGPLSNQVEPSRFENRTNEAQPINYYLFHNTAETKPILYKPEEETQSENTTETTNTENEPAKTQAKNNTILTKSGPRAIRQCKFNPPPPENTNITELTNAIQTLLEYIKNTKDKLNQMSESIHNCDLETSDLLHEIEFSNLNETEQKEEYQKIKEVRERRRTYKEMQNYMEILNCFIDITPNIYNKLDTLLYKLKEQQKRHETALFSPRIRTDVKENERIRYITQIKGEKT